MAADLQPPELPPNGALPTAPLSSENAAAPSIASKRQRRPSVRLGDIGDQPATLSYDSYLRRTKQWAGHDSSSSKHHRLPHKDAAKSSKTRPLTNLGNGADNHSHETLETDDANLNLSNVRKAKRGGGGGGGGNATKKVRSNWVSKVDQETTAGDDDDKFSGEDGGDEGFREIDAEEGSESPLREVEHSPIHSLDNPGMDLRHNSQRIDKEALFLGKRRSTRARVSESRGHGHGHGHGHNNDGVDMEFDGDGPSENDARNWKCGSSVDRNGGRFWALEDGVRMWLNGLGLGQYAPVFEIHEVDEDVLPQLTLEDLKDMGINAVGSRRKLYSAIQKLAKGFS